MGRLTLSRNPLIVWVEMFQFLFQSVLIQATVCQREEIQFQESRN